MKKITSRRILLSAIVTLFCIGSANAYDLPIDTINAIGGSAIHDRDAIEQKFLEREIESDYQRYNDEKVDREKNIQQESTIIEKQNSDVIQAQVEELETKGVYVGSIEVAPSEILTREEIESVITKYAGKNLFMTDIQQMVDEINNLYAQKGFVTARAYLPEQQVQNGALYIGLIESKIGKITINQNKWTRSKYISDRIPEKENQLFDIVKLEKDVLDFNRYNEGVKLSANLKAGETEGTTDIELTAEESFPFHIMGVMDNAGRYNTGKLRGGPVLVADSLFGRRDKLTVGSYFSGGAISPFADYNIPVNKYDGRVGFSFSSNFAQAKWGPGSQYNPIARSYIYSLYYTQPILRRTGFELKGYGSLNYKRSWSTFDRFPQPLKSEFTNKDDITSFDVGLNMRKDTKRGIWYANQGVGVAVPIFDSRSSYVKINGGLLRLHDFSHGVIGQLRANYQVIPNDKDIPYLDQFQTGGLLTARGYSEGLLLGKSGYFASAELMFPLLPRTIKSPRTGQQIPFVGQYIKGAVFADHAGVFPSRSEDVGPGSGSYFLASIGAGLRIQLPGDLSARLYWGFPLINNGHEYDRKFGRFHFELTLEPNIDKLLRDRSIAAKVVPEVQKQIIDDYVNNYDDVRHYDYFLDGSGAL